MRQAEISRTTKETDILVRLDLDGGKTAEIDTGIGFFFRTHIHLKHYLLFTTLSLLIGTALIAYWAQTWIPVALVGLVLVAVVVYKLWTKKNFGGASGDLYGAFIEGTEALLWITLLCLS